MTVKTRKKLIEVALPLDVINTASGREKSIRHGHPSTLHLWWARRPLAAARAVVFAQTVDDPTEYVDELLDNSQTRSAAENELVLRQDLYEKQVVEGDPGPAPRVEDCAADLERLRLFSIIDDLVQWENTTNVTVLQNAQAEIWKSWRRACSDNVAHPRAGELFNPEKLPAFHDPFAGGGSLPLEANRLGLDAYASDLNPVAVLINKAMIEFPPMFGGIAPVNPAARSELERGGRWNGTGAQGLAEDVRHYGNRMREEAGKRIGNLYPKVRITAAMTAARPDLIPYIGQELTVIAWLWARTVKSPNPAFADVDVPLASTFILSKMKGNEAYVEPIVEKGSYRFTVKVGKPADADSIKNGTKLSRGANFRCVMSGSPIAPDYIYGEANAGRMHTRLMAIVVEGVRGRVYLEPTVEHEAASLAARPQWKPDVAMPENPRWFSPPLYGLKTYGDLFTPRQLVALTTFSDLVIEARERAYSDALAAGLENSDKTLRDGGVGAMAYANAISVYLGFAVSSLSDRMSAICTWDAGGATWGTKTRNTFARQAIPMSWDFAEVNPLSSQSGSIGNSIDYTTKGIVVSGLRGHVTQADAATQDLSLDKIISTDPPYYDNIGYADLSDFFYVWLRRSLRSVFPDLFATLAVPKAEELVATPYRHGGREKAETFFLDGMTQAMHRLAEQAHPAFPVTIYYAFKQSETANAEGTASTGWETFLDAVIKAGFGISGTWPIRTELSNRMIGSGTNALASSIVLVCRSHIDASSSATRREFVSELRAELPAALRHLQAGNIAPVDLAQAAIGPGMAVYTRYARVLDAEGKPVSVREALSLINATLDEVLAEQEGDFDADSRWALAWFEQNGFAEGEYGIAETLSKAKNTSVAALAASGILESLRGKVRLLKPEELSAVWNPAADPRLISWEVVHHLIRVLASGGEKAAAELVGRLGLSAETARELAYRLYTICERKKRSAEALTYNGLVKSWPEIVRLSHESGGSLTTETDLFAMGER